MKQFSTLCFLLVIVSTIKAFKIPFHKTDKWIISKRFAKDALSLSNNENDSNTQQSTIVDQSSILVDSSVANESEQCDVYFDDEFLDNLKKKRSYLSIVIERLMQTIDDMQVSRKEKQTSLDPSNTIGQREKMVVLGSGWGSYSFLKSVDLTKFDVTVISPRNYFTFTPMLAASAVGTVEFRSICSPIRNISPLINFIEASALEINANTKKIKCQSIKCAGTVCEDYLFDVDYDKLLIAVGATVNTFGIKGVKDYCLFLKQVEDAANIRNALAYCFERANIPNLTEEEKQTALTFVIVGAGPTGVELIAELKDWIGNEGRNYFPHLIKFVQIVLVEAGNCVLPIFDATLQKEALERITAAQEKLKQAGLIGEGQEMTKVLLSAGVKEVGERSITLSTGQDIGYGFCVWAAGIGPTPIVSNFIQSLPTQKEMLNKTRGRVLTDGWLRVKGANDVFCIGDCNYMEDNNLPATAQVASQQGAYLGRLISKGFQLGSYTDKPPSKVIPIGNPESTATSTPSSISSTSVTTAAVSSTTTTTTGTSSDVDWSVMLYPSEKLGIGSLGVSLVSPSSATNTNINNISSTSAIANSSSSSLQIRVDYAKPFQFLNLGVLAYVGASQALAQVSVNDKNVLGKGPVGFLLWRGIYWFKQVSWRNRVLIAFDWIKGRLFGRDIGNVKI